VAKRRAKGFSLGMGQRLGIASALLGDPAVLIFDETVNGLDPDGIHWVRTLMRTLAAEGRNAGGPGDGPLTTSEEGPSAPARAGDRGAFTQRNRTAWDPSNERGMPAEQAKRDHKSHEV
jgi:hypothetical protein